jgi:hypothetical protein
MKTDSIVVADLIAGSADAVDLKILTFICCIYGPSAYPQRGRFSFNPKPGLARMHLKQRRKIAGKESSPAPQLPAGKYVE